MKMLCWQNKCFWKKLEEIDQMDNNINTNLDDAEEISALLEIINQSESASQSFTDAEKRELFGYSQNLLNGTEKSLEGLTPEQAKPLNERFADTVEGLSQSLYALDQNMWSNTIKYYVGILTQKWESIKSTVMNALGIGDGSSSTDNATQEPPSTAAADSNQGSSQDQPTMQMAPYPEQPPLGASPRSADQTSSYVPPPPAGRNDGISSHPRGSNVRRLGSSSIRQATKPISQPGGPEYFVRNGFNKYSPAVQADLNSGQQLFMRNPNPALRMVYPYVKVESMVKRARRATPA